MKENRKKEILCAAAILLLLSSIVLPMTTAQYGNFLKRQNQSAQPLLLEDTDEKVYHVAVGPIGTKSRDKVEIFNSFSEKDFLSFKEKFLSLKDDNEISTEEFVYKQLKILSEYDLLPPNITVDNIRDSINKYISQSHEKGLKVGSKSTSNEIFYPHVRFGPTLNIYASFMSQYTYINDMRQRITFFFNITRLSTILQKIFQDDLIFGLLENISVGYYASLVGWQIGIGGSIGFFSSLGPTPNWNYHFFGPFLGIFIFPITLLGLYIFYEVDDPSYPGGSFEIPIFDFFISIPAFFSLVIPGWYVNPPELP